MITARSLRRDALVVLGTAVVVLAALPPERARPLRAFALAIVLVVCWRVRRAAGAGTRPVADWVEPRSPLGPPDEQNVRLARLESSLAFATQSGRTADGTLRPLFRRLVEEQLRIRHGVVLETAPDQAQRLMGEQLWQVLSAPPAGTSASAAAAGLTLDQVAELVACAERI